MSDTSERFSEYLRKKREFQQNAQQSTAGSFTPRFLGQASSQPDENDRGFLGTVGDLFMTPVYAFVTNPFNAMLDLGVKVDDAREKAAEGDNLGAFTDIASGVGGVATANLRGFTTAARRAFGGEIAEGEGLGVGETIERTADIANRNNPNYTDVPDNIDPVAKATFGLAGDILLDPTVWLSGGALIAPKVFSRGAGTASKAVKNSEELIEKINSTPAPTKITAAEAAEKNIPEAAALPPLSRAEQLSVSAPTAQKIAPDTPIADNFPSSSVAKQVEDAVDSAPLNSKEVSDAVNEIMEKTMSGKMVNVPGLGQVTARGALNDFFKTLKKPVAESTSKLMPKFGSYVSNLRKELGETGASVRINQVLPNYTPPVVPGSSAAISQTVEGALRQYDQVSKINTPQARAVREAIEKSILLPLQQRYNAAVRAGHSINTFGVAKSAEASAEILESQGVADIVLRNLSQLSEADKLRGRAILGDDFFDSISLMNKTQMSKFLDELNVILQESGTFKDIKPLLGTDTGSELLKIFDIDEAAYNAAKIDVENRMLKAKNGVQVKTLEETLTKVDESPFILENVSENLSVYGMNATRYDFLKSSENASQVFDIVLDITGAGSKASLRNFSTKKRKEEGFNFVTDDGYFRTDPQYGEGYGVLPDALNTQGQMNYIVAAAIRMNKYFEEVPFLKELPGFKKMSAKESILMASIKTFENALEAKGIPIFTSIRFTREGSALTRNLRFSQIHETLFNSSAQRALRIALFKAGTGVAYTKIMDAVMTALVRSDRMAPDQLREEVLKTLRSSEDFYSRDVTNWFANPKAKATVGKQKYTSGKLSEELADAIIESIPKFEQQAAINTTARRARGVAEGEELAVETSNILLKMLHDPVKVAQSGIAVAKSGRVVQDVAKTVGNVSDLGASIGNLRVTLGLGENFKMSAETAVALAEKVASQSPKAIARAQRESFEQAAKIAEDVEEVGTDALIDVINGRARIENPNNQKLFDDVLADTLDQAAKPVNGMIATATSQVKAAYVKAFSFADRIFNVNRGMGVENNLYIKQLFFGMENIQEKLARKLLIPLAKIGQKPEYKGFVDSARSRTIAQEAFNAMREGRTAAGVAGKMQQELTPLFARFFNLDGVPENALMGNLLLRQGASLERVNDVLSRRKVLETTSGRIAKSPDEYYDLGKIAEELGPDATPEQLMNALSEQWKTWDIQDPLLFLDRYTRAVSQVVGEASYVNGFVSQGLKFNQISLTAKPGFIRISPSDGTTFAKHLKEDIWVDPEGGEPFIRISEFVDEISSIGNNGWERMLDEFTDAFKYAATQARPGHHARNFLGGATMTGAGMGARHYRQAGIWSFKVRNLVEKEDILDVAKALESYGEPVTTKVRNLPGAQQVVYKTKKGTVTAGDLAEAINRHGVNPEVRTAEAFDALGSGQTLVGKGIQKFLSVASLGLAARGGRMERMWSAISRAQDHVNRDHMFIQYVMQALDGKPMTRGIGKTITFDWKKKDVMEDVYVAAAERVAKFHPTGQFLTAIERRIPRRAFPFYAWNKGALIALTEAIVMHPGRVNWPYKINYAVAEASGVDPNSYYDPFPTDQRFPSFLLEDLNSPQWVVNNRYYGLQPGIAQFDVFNQFAGPNVGGGLYEGVVNALNPAVKLPIELATQTRLTSRSPISDLSDYVDSSIPTVSYIANATTYSPSSIFIDRKLEQNAKYESGDKTDLSRLISLANWLFGFNLREYSRPDLPRFAQIEESIRRAEERERNR